MSASDYTVSLSRFAQRTRFEDIPSSAINAAKRLVKDTLACAVAGFGLPSSEIIRKVIAADGGAKEATILVSGQRIPARAATYINSHSSNAIDADDTLNYKGHIAAATVPAALAIAERQQSTGRDFLASVAIGYEIAGRLGLAFDCLKVDQQAGFQLQPTAGFGHFGFGAAVSAARLLVLDESAMQHCFGIAGATTLAPSAGPFGNSLPRPMTKYGMYGTMGEAGVTAALLAAQGFTGEQSILDGDEGLWRMVGSLDCNWTAMTDRLGERWLVEEVSYKPYPACRFLNAAIDMYLDLRRTHDIEADEIDRVEVGLHGVAIQKFMNSDRVETMIDGCFSMPYLLAAATYMGAPGPSWHTEAARQDGRMLAFMTKVDASLEPGSAEVALEDLLKRGHNARMPSSMRIYARGETYSAKRDYCRGDAFTPDTVMSDQAMDRKFADFCSASLPARKIQQAIALIDCLERADTVLPLIEQLTQDISVTPAAPQ